MDVEKITYTVQCIQQVYGLSEKTTNLLIKNIVARIKLYETKHPKVNAQNDLNEMYAFKPVDGVYDLTEFFLNRLLFNIREYDLKGETVIGKGEFTPVRKMLAIAKYTDLKDITENAICDYVKDEAAIKKAIQKVFNHEVGHALQTRYSSGTETISYPNSKLKYSKYIEVLTLLNRKYPNVNQNIPIKNKESEYLDGGLRFKGVNNNETFKRKCYLYQPNNVLDEILNEDESLIITECNVIQRQKEYGTNGDYRNIYNYESSNCYITPYAKMIKSLIGPKIFDYMYVNSDGLINRFEEYRDLVKDVYNEELSNDIPVLAFVIDKLERIKSLKDQNEECKKECMMLDLFFAKCLEKFINNYLTKNNELSNATYNTIISHIENMQNSMLTNDDLNKKRQLPQHKVLNELRIKLSEYNDNYRITQTTEKVVRSM